MLQGRVGFVCVYKQDVLFIQTNPKRFLKSTHPIHQASHCLHTVANIRLCCQVAFVLQAQQRIEIDACVVILFLLFLALALPLHAV